MRGHAEHQHSDVIAQALLVCHMLIRKDGIIKHVKIIYQTYISSNLSQKVWSKPEVSMHRGANGLFSCLYGVGALASTGCGRPLQMPQNVIPSTEWDINELNITLEMIA